jgi:hypothetical protein
MPFPSQSHWVVVIGTPHLTGWLVDARAKRNFLHFLALAHHHLQKQR